jgi:DNA-binding response OmpR family regulator
VPCARCRQLRDRIAELEDVIGTSERASLRYSLLGLPATLRRILGFLVSRDIANRDGLFAALHGDKPECDQPEIKVLDQQICRLRQRLGPHGIAIKTEWGIGYSMSLADKAKLEDLLERKSLHLLKAIP